MKPWIQELETRAFGSGSYSQSYQDELLDLIFANIGTTNPTPICVEFGFNTDSLTGSSGSNVARLVFESKWDSLLLDGAYENPEINLHRHFLTPSNIVELFRKYGVPRQPEYVSVDVDSTDLWLFDALLKDFRAMVFTVEYNCNYPLDAAITFPNDPDLQWGGDRGYGASLKALNMVAEKHGYSLLWVIPGLDSFYIRNDLIEDGSGQICFPFEKWRSCTELACHPPLNDRKKLKSFIDYEVYVSTGGDLEKSRRSAYPVCRKYLSDNLATRVLKRLQNLVARPFRMLRASRG